MVVVGTLAAEVNSIHGSHCLIFPKAEVFCDFGGFVFWWAFCTFSLSVAWMVSVQASHSFLMVCLFPWGFIPRLKESFFNFFASLRLRTKVLTRGAGVGRPLQ